MREGLDYHILKYLELSGYKFLGMFQRSNFLFIEQAALALNLMKS